MEGDDKLADYVLSAETTCYSPHGEGHDPDTAQITDNRVVYSRDP